MIYFHCNQCGMKFCVRDEFAGRSTSCPTCKHPLVVPRAELTEAYVPPPGPIPGSASSLDHADCEAGITLDSGNSGADGPSVEVRLASAGKNAGRYVIEKEIARGGMGAVLRALDRDIHREVAVKYMLDAADPRKKARFVEEAQITGQLEHPNIVPIHELGLDANKRLFFAMKLVKGRSLAQVLTCLRGQAKAAAKEWPLSRLLNILVNVCNALAYAHARGVVHRDLKPANIMVGDFGEVYVMDWGLAKLMRGGLASREREQPEDFTGDTAAAFFASISAADPSREASKIKTSRAEDTDLTQEGMVMGTPAYMPPEQARGKVQAIDARSDVYALGAILYEILTLQVPVDKTGGYLEVLRRVTQGNIQPPEQRAPERAGQGLIPRELSAIALKALSLEPGRRYPSAESLRRDIERYQEGRWVSAKEDTARELVVKFVKRNRAFSATAAAALLLLAVVVSYFLKINYTARLHAEAHEQKALQAYTEFQQEQRQKETAIRRALPAFVRSAQQPANDGELVEAERQVELSLTYDPKLPEGRLLKGQLLVAREAWDQGRAELEQYLQLRPLDTNSRLLEDLVAKGDPKDPGPVARCRSGPARSEAVRASELSPEQSRVERERARPTGGPVPQASYRRLAETRHATLAEAGRSIILRAFRSAANRQSGTLEGHPAQSSPSDGLVQDRGSRAAARHAASPFGAGQNIGP